LGINIIKGKADDGGFILEGNIHVTRRELEALATIAEGYDNEKGANKLGISYTTFRNHTYNVMKKLGANNRVEALIKAVESGMIYIGLKGDTESMVPGNYFVCKGCGRAFIWDDVVMMHEEPFIVNHILLEPPDWPKCPNEQCRGYATDSYPWVRVREHYPEYPETPEKGVEYSINELLDREYQAYLETKKELEEGNW